MARLGGSGLVPGNHLAAGRTDVRDAFSLGRKKKNKLEFGWRHVCVAHPELVFLALLQLLHDCPVLLGVQALPDLPRAAGVPGNRDGVISIIVIVIFKLLSSLL